MGPNPIWLLSLQEEETDTEVETRREDSCVEMEAETGVVLPQTTGCLRVPEGRSCCSVARLCPALCHPRDCSTPGFPVLHCLMEFAQTHVHRVGDAIQPFHPLLPPSPPVLNLSQHQGLFQSVSSSHQVAKVLELQL